MLVQFLSEEDGISKKVSVLIELPGSIGMEFILLFRGGPDAKFTATGTEFQNREPKKPGMMRKIAPHAKIF